MLLALNNLIYYRLFQHKDLTDMRHISLLFLNLAIVISVTFIPPAAADIYKWVDGEGNTHYTQHPPPAGIKGETMTSSAKVDADAAKKRAQKQIDMSNEARDARLKQAEEKQKAEAEQAKQKERCEQAKKRFASYSRARVNIVGKDGTRTRATEEQRQAELAKAEKAIKELCK